MAEVQSRTLAIRKGKTTYRLTIPDNSRWGTVKEKTSALLGLPRKDVDFCLTADSKKGVLNNDIASVDECFLVERRDGKWILPTWTDFEHNRVGVLEPFPETLVHFIESTRCTSIAL